MPTTPSLVETANFANSKRQPRAGRTRGPQARHAFSLSFHSIPRGPAPRPTTQLSFSARFSCSPCRVIAQCTLILFLFVVVFFVFRFFFLHWMTHVFRMVMSKTNSSSSTERYKICIIFVRNRNNKRYHIYIYEFCSK